MPGSFPIRFLRKLSFVGVCLLVSCTAPTGSGPGSVPGPGTDSEPGGVIEGDTDPTGDAAIEIAFADDPTDSLYARGKTDEGDEFAVFVERDDDGRPVVLRELATQLSDGTVVRAIADGSGRPVRFEERDSSVTIIYRDSDATVVHTDAAGVITQTVVSLPQTARSEVKAPVAFQTVTTDFLCGELLALYRLLVSIFFDCPDGSDSALCSSTIAQAALASLALCSEEVDIVPNAQLETEIASDPKTLGVGVALSVVAMANKLDEGAPTLTLDEPGTFTCPLTVTDAGADIAVEPGQAAALEGSATGGIGGYAYE